MLSIMIQSLFFVAMPPAISADSFADHYFVSHNQSAVSNTVIKDPPPPWGGPVTILQSVIKQKYRCPITTGCRIIRSFNVGENNWNSGHRGIDLAVSSTIEIIAPADGTVSYVGVIDSRPVLSITHDDGIRTTYEPLVSNLTKGAKIRRGEVIGTVSLGHCARALCLHWGAKTDADSYLNPTWLLEPRVVALLE
ncbi:M23 family metallopeptidase [Arcanobacterium ihumii]|uniref:M23 family metallopeptidase n=1 Tax=Arcanobacterium ihumii TaxID=2138162 RepID=UPI000F52D5B2|nr:M23 family metallopeptidase [Arcanobacterium ihumii]